MKKYFFKRSLSTVGFVAAPPPPPNLPADWLQMASQSACPLRNDTNLQIHWRAHCHWQKFSENTRNC
jgi:hypothetical protein